MHRLTRIHQDGTPCVVQHIRFVIEKQLFEVELFNGTYIRLWNCFPEGNTVEEMMIATEEYVAAHVDRFLA